jgi:hypothetical protein
MLWPCCIAVVVIVAGVTFWSHHCIITLLCDMAVVAVVVVVTSWFANGMHYMLRDPGTGLSRQNKSINCLIYHSQCSI